MLKPPPPHLLARLQPHGRVGGVPQRVDADRERALGREHAGDLALELGLRLADERGVVDQAVLGGLVLRLERPGGFGGACRYVSLVFRNNSGRLAKPTLQQASCLK